MKSMTAMAERIKAFSFGQLHLQLQTLNKRFLEVSVLLPKEWQKLEILLKKKVQGKIKRGKVSLNLSFTPSEDLQPTYEADTSVVQGLFSLAQQVSKQLQLEPQAQQQLLQGLLLKDSKWVHLNYRQLDPDMIETVENFVDEGLEDLLVMKKKEGSFLAEDLTTRFQHLETHLKLIQKHSKASPLAYKDKLLERLKQAQLSYDMEDERLLKELCLYADKVDITEELTRFASHIQQCRQLMQDPKELVGKKLDFLVQELSREIHTISAKTPMIEVSKLGIEVKTELEKIREQLQNIE